MNEPLYEYVKGQGWVPNGERRIQAKGWDGTRYIIIDREPKNNEWYIGYDPEEQGWVENGRVCLETFRRHVEIFWAGRSGQVGFIEGRRDRPRALRVTVILDE